MDQFEINLKELHSHKSKAPKSTKLATRKPSKTNVSLTAMPALGDGASVYTVCPGDHLFLILMRNYHLSNDAAENLIPEIMRLNHIGSPKGLVVGQRLNIPLPLQGQMANNGTLKSISTSVGRHPEAEKVEVRAEIAGARYDEVKSGAQEAMPEPLTVAAALQPKQTPRTPQTQALSRNIALPAALTIAVAPSCEFAREIANRIGLPAADMAKYQADHEIAANANNVPKLVLGCGLSAAEIYTYERLLSKNNICLLFFNGNEHYSRVVDKLANCLSLDYETIKSDVVGELPQNYIFSKVGNSDQKMHMKIVPAVK